MKEEIVLPHQPIPIIQKFLTFSQLHMTSSQREIVQKICTAFSHLPYENFTKILANEHSSVTHKRRPETVLHDFFTQGTGGTCFSLTDTLIALLSAVKITAYPILADRHYGPDTHCAVLLHLDDGFYLVDPGYLIFQPIPIPISGSGSYPGLFNTVELTASKDGKEVALHTILNNDRKYRMSYKLAPATEERFEKAWDDSFLFEMMSYPVLTLVDNDRYIYMQGDTIKIRQNGILTKEKISSDNGHNILDSLNVSNDIIKKILI